jgi:hypothetical protein
VRVGAVRMSGLARPPGRRHCHVREPPRPWSPSVAPRRHERPRSRRAASSTSQLAGVSGVVGVAIGVSCGTFDTVGRLSNGSGISSPSVSAAGRRQKLGRHATRALPTRGQSAYSGGSLDRPVDSTHWPALTNTGDPIDAPAGVRRATRGMASIPCSDPSAAQSSSERHVCTAPSTVRWIWWHGPGEGTFGRNQT